MNSGKCVVGHLAACGIVVLMLCAAGCVDGARALPGPAVVFNPDAPIAAPPKIGPHFSTSALNEAALAKLRQTKMTVDYDANHLQNVIEGIREATGVNIVINWRALHSGGGRRDVPITLQLSDVAVDRLLDLVLNQAGGDDMDLDYIVDEGTILIATRAFFAEHPSIRIYDIGDLFDARFVLDIHDAPPVFDGNPLTVNGPPGEAPPVTVETLAKARRENAMRIMDLIRNRVEPDSWRAAGGLHSSMVHLSGSLIINTHARAHRQVAALLQALRRHRSMRLGYSVQLIVLPDAVYEQQMRPHLVKRPATGDAPLAGSGVIADEHAATIARYARQSANARAIALPAVVMRNDTTSQVVLGASEPLNDQPDPLTRAALGLPELRTVTHGVNCTLRGMHAAGDGFVTIDLDTVIANRHADGAAHRAGYRIVMPEGSTYLADAGNIPPSALAALAPGLRIANPRLLMVIHADVVKPAMEDAE